MQITATATPTPGHREHHPIAAALNAADPSSEGRWESGTALTWHERRLRAEDGYVASADPHIRHRAEAGFLATQLAHDPAIREWARKVSRGETPGAIRIVADLDEQTLRMAPKAITADLELGPEPEVRIEIQPHTGMQLRMNDAVRRVLEEHGIGIRISTAQETRQWRPDRR